MSFLPEIIDGELIEKQEPKPYKPPKLSSILQNAERVAELENLNRPKVTEDFSDSKFLNY